MAMRKTLAITATLLLALNGCASKPTPRPELTGLPTLETGWARIYFTAGKYQGPFESDLRLNEHVGPVFINNQSVGNTAYREHIAVDVKPGSYEMHCSPTDPVKNQPEKRQISTNAGEQIYLACDVIPKGSNGFGLIGLAVRDVISITTLVERPLHKDSQLVGYKKFDATNK